ncbi:MAG: NADH-quinone oxidoreductase subunit J [Proteobacteria bacterium]|nr:NADH-quinone oxidoreductase subunit J [Pseudomonadota bacterium]
MIAALSFYLFATVTLLAGLMVILSRNPVHSVLFLILAFFSAAALFVLLGAEFLAMVLIIVYVGAVAVLFLFVVMMLDIDYVQLREGFAQYMPIGGIIGLMLLAELIMVATARMVDPPIGLGSGPAIPDADAVTNTEALGRLLYTDYIYAFQTAGLVLLVAMIGAIVLTHRKRPGVKRQVIADQISRTAKDAIEVVKVKSGEGI